MGKRKIRPGGWGTWSKLINQILWGGTRAGSNIHHHWATPFQSVSFHRSLRWNANSVPRLLPAESFNLPTRPTQCRLQPLPPTMNQLRKIAHGKRTDPCHIATPLMKEQATWRNKHRAHTGVGGANQGARDGHCKTQTRSQLAVERVPTSARSARRYLQSERRLP